MIQLYAGRRGSVPKRPKGADCKSAGLCLRRFESFPAHQIGTTRTFAWKEFQVELLRTMRQFVAHALLAHSVEHFHGKGEVVGSIPTEGSQYLAA